MISSKMSLMQGGVFVDLRERLESLSGEQLQEIAEYIAQLLEQQGAAIPDPAAIA